MKPINTVIFKLRRCAANALSCLALLTVPAWCQAQANEYEIKAAFLFNFALFTQPIAASAPPSAASIESDEAAYRVCIYGKDPFGTALKSLANRKIARRQILLVRGVETDALKACQLVFFNDPDRDAVRRALLAVSGLPIITVAELKDFPVPTVMFNLIMQDEKVAFQINTVAAKAQQLDVSTKLLRLAKNAH